MEYLLKASAIIILFFACYKLFLQRETFFQANRWFLLIGLIISACIPFIVIPIYIEYTPVPITFYETTQVVTQHTQQQTSSIDFTSILMFIYLAGVLFFFGKVMLQFLSLNKLIKNHKKTKQDQFVIIETDKDIAPFSFFNHIVFNPNQFTKEELNHVITHEKIHAKQYHSIDIILIQIATILFWFNPFIWWYKKALQQNLEFIADYKTQQQIDCAKGYQTVLLKASLSQNQLALPTNFYQSLIKKRIIMLQKSKSKNLSYLKLAFILPILGLFLMSFNTEDIYVAKADNTNLNKINADVFIITSTTSDKEIEAIKNRLEVQTEGLKIRFTDIKRNSDGEITNLSIETKLKGKDSYIRNASFGDDSGIPIENILLKIEDGDLTFGDENKEQTVIISKDGIVSKMITGKKTQNIGTIHVQNNGDNIKMDFDNENKEKNSFTYKIDTHDIDGEKSKLIVTENGKKPLYVVDGKIISEDNTSFVAMNAEQVKSVNVLKGKDATDKYGEKGENGVVEIITKTQDNSFNIKQNDTTKKENPWKIGKVETSTITAIYDKKDTEEAIKNDISFIKTEINLEKNGENNALIIINGKVTDYEKFSSLNPTEIKSVNVLKGDSAKQIYGTKGENGVIEIITKDKDTYKWITKESDTIKKESPWEVHYEVSSLVYTDDEDPSKSLSTSHISKKTPELILNKHKAYLKTQGVDLQYSTIKRNKKGEITKIKISVEDKNGNKSKVTYESTNGISPIEIKLNGSGDVSISSK